MATSGLSNDTRNFQCIIVASVDVIKLPLSDILDSNIKPVDLYHKIKSLSTLKLRSDQQKICFIPPPGVPDYNKFDVTLLYTLIRNLCSLPSPAQGWGKEPKPTDTQISDDIERLRLFRNNYYAHAESAVISDAVFKDVWKNLKLVFRRIQPKTGCSVDYEAELIKIERTTFTDDYLTTLRVILEALVKLEKQTDGRDEPDIFIQGENEILCGGTARFEAEVKNVESSCWSITWQKHRGDVIKRIDTNMGRYSGSTKKKLVINDVSKKDEGEYQAVLRFESNGPDYKSRNTIRLHAIGETPFLNIFEATARFEGITIQYNCGVSEHSPIVHRIEWSKNGQPLQHDTEKYVGGGIYESCLTITSPTNEDKGNYSCKVTNAVGSVSKDIMLDVASVQISADSQVCCGSKTTIKSVVSSIPTPERIEWQNSKDGIDFSCISKPEFFEIDDTFTCPFFLLPKTTFADKLYYRLLVWNGIGESVSNIVYLNITGSPPNITTSLETDVKNRSVKLMGNVVIYDNSPAIVETFWTKNGEQISFDTEENGEKLLKANTDNPSLTIRNVSSEDAGEYQLTATNAVGSSTSDVIALAIPIAFVEKIEDEKNGGQRITVAIKSFPAPCLVQWSAKCKNDIFKPVDINAEEYKGTTVSFPHPVLVVKKADMLDKLCLRLDVTNFIGKTRYKISGNISPVVPRGPEIMENTLYRDHGASVRFIKLNSILVRQFPHQKLKLLKFLLTTSDKIKNRTSVLEAETTFDCLRILQEENLFTQEDVIFMQFLCRETDCFDLYEKCIEYAEKQRALCYFEKKSVNGYVDVQFHIQGEISGYTKENIQEVIDTVAAILDCNKEDILLNGVRPSTSFLLTLSVKDVYSRKLSALNKGDRLKLRRLNIDYLIIEKDKLDLQGSADSVFTKDGTYSGQDVVRCHLCNTPAPHLHCDICGLHLCKFCMEDHLLDKSTEHRMVPSVFMRRTRSNLKCLKHTSYCYMYCMECDIPVCAHCLSATDEHEGHTFVAPEGKLGIQLNILERDLQELEKSIYPKYQGIASIISIQKADLYENSKKITATIDTHGEDLHKEVDIVIRKLKSNVYEINSKYLSVLDKQEDEFTRTISEITESIAHIKKLLYSNEASLVLDYKSRNSKFRKLPPKLTISLPRFTPKKINEEQIYQQFGSLSEFSIEKEEPGSTVDFPRVEYSAINRPLIDEPRIITEINTGNDSGVHSVSCVTDEHIWTCNCTDNIMRLSNLQGELVQSIKTKSGICPGGIAVTRSGELVYTDPKDGTVNIVKNTHLQTVIRLVLWSPYGVCCTSAGDLLVALVHCDLKQTKIVRYSGFIEKQTIQYNDKGISLFSTGSFIKHISENSNLDICVADNGVGAVVVVNQFGNLRFTYSGLRYLFTIFTSKRSFDPAGITTDSQSRILIADQNNQRIHILDENGLFLRYIDNCHLQSPCGLSMDFRENLFVSELSTNKVKKIQYCI